MNENIWEKVVYLTPEKKYNKFTKEPSENIEEIKPKNWRREYNRDYD